MNVDKARDEKVIAAIKSVAICVGRSLNSGDCAIFHMNMTTEDALRCYDLLGKNCMVRHRKSPFPVC
jgi:hypothetical protein